MSNKYRGQTWVDAEVAVPLINGLTCTRCKGQLCAPVSVCTDCITQLRAWASLYVQFGEAFAEHVPVDKALDVAKTLDVDPLIRKTY